MIVHRDRNRYGIQVVYTFKNIKGSQKNNFFRKRYSCKFIAHLFRTYIHFKLVKLYYFNLNGLPSTCKICHIVTIAVHYQIGLTHTFSFLGSPFLPWFHSIFKTDRTSECYLVTFISLKFLIRNILYLENMVVKCKFRCFIFFLMKQSAINSSTRFLTITL